MCKRRSKSRSQIAERRTPRAPPLSHEFLNACGNESIYTAYGRTTADQQVISSSVDLHLFIPFVL